MTTLKPFTAGRLLKIAGSAMLLASLAAIAGGSHAQTRDLRTTDQTLRSAWPELATYLVGYGFAITLTIAAFALVHWHWTAPNTALFLVLGLGLVQIIVHFHCFLHINLQDPARDDLQLILFSTLIVLLIVGGTLVVLFNLRERMM